jgi:hypothetical protein
MRNGTHALQLPVSEPVSAPEVPVEHARIGEHIADALISLAYTIEGYQRSGVLDQAAKEEGGSRVAKVAMLQLDHELGDDDFADQAHHAGRQVLLRRYFTNGYDRKLADAAIEIHIDSVLLIAGHVVRDERVIRAAWAN